LPRDGRAVAVIVKALPGLDDRPLDLAHVRNLSLTCTDMSGHVCTQVLDHTSVLKLIEQKWNLPPLTNRDAAAASPLDALDLASPPAFLTPPSLPPPALRWAGH
jgi:hypothetical protein